MDIFGMYVQADTVNPHVSVEDWDWYIYTYNPFYILYFFCLWDVWPLNSWLHFLINVFIHVNDYAFWTELVLYLSMFMVYIHDLCVYILVLHVISWLSSCISLLIVYLLINELSNQINQINQFHFWFLFWDCTSLFVCSLGTISSTNREQG